MEAQEKIKEGSSFTYEHEGELYQCRVFSKHWKLDESKLLGYNTSFYLDVKKIVPKKFLWIEYNHIEWTTEYCFRRNMYNESYEYKLKYESIDGEKWYNIEDIKFHISKAIEDYHYQKQLLANNKNKYKHAEKI